MSKTMTTRKDGLVAPECPEFELRQKNINAVVQIIYWRKEARWRNDDATRGKGYRSFVINSKTPKWVKREAAGIAMAVLFVRMYVSEPQSVPQLKDKCDQRLAWARYGGWL